MRRHVLSRSPSLFSKQRRSLQGIWVSVIQRSGINWLQSTKPVIINFFLIFFFFFFVLVKIFLHGVLKGQRFVFQC